MNRTTLEIVKTISNSFLLLLLTVSLVTIGISAVMIVLKRNNEKERSKFTKRLTYSVVVLIISMMIFLATNFVMGPWY